MQNLGEIILGLTDLKGDVKRPTDGFEGVRGEHQIAERNVERRRPLEFFDEKEFCVASTWFEKEQRKITYSMGGNKTEIDFCVG